MKKLLKFIYIIPILTFVFVLLLTNNNKVHAAPQAIFLNSIKLENYYIRDPLDGSSRPELILAIPETIFIVEEGTTGESFFNGDLMSYVNLYDFDLNSFELMLMPSEEVIEKPEESIFPIAGTYRDGEEEPYLVVNIDATDRNTPSKGIINYLDSDPIIYQEFEIPKYSKFETIYNQCVDIFSSNGHTITLLDTHNDDYSLTFDSRIESDMDKRFIGCYEYSFNIAAKSANPTYKLFIINADSITNVNTDNLLLEQDVPENIEITYTNLVASFEEVDSEHTYIEYYYSTDETNYIKINENDTITITTHIIIVGIYQTNVDCYLYVCDSIENLNIESLVWTYNIPKNSSINYEVLLDGFNSLQSDYIFIEYYYSLDGENFIVFEENTEITISNNTLLVGIYQNSILTHIYLSTTTDINISNEHFTEEVDIGYVYACAEILSKAGTIPEGYRYTRILVNGNYDGGYLDITNADSHIVSVTDYIFIVLIEKITSTLTIHSNLANMNTNEITCEYNIPVNLSIPEVENYIIIGLFDSEDYVNKLPYKNNDKLTINEDTDIYVQYVQYKNKTFNFVKSNKGFLPLSTISNIFKANLINDFNCVLYSENYVGNGSNIGRYSISYTITKDDIEFIDTVEIIVYDGLICNYIYDNIIVIDNNIKYSKEYLVADLQLIDILPKTELHVNIEGDYYNSSNNEPIENPTIGEYDTILSYRTTDDENSKEFKLKVVSAVQSDITVQEVKDYSTIEKIVGLSILLIMTIIALKFIKRFVRRL